MVPVCPAALSTQRCDMMTTYRVWREEDGDAQDAVFGDGDGWG